MAPSLTPSLVLLALTQAAGIAIRSKGEHVFTTHGPFIWPMPKSYKNGTSLASVLPSLSFQVISSSSDKALADIDAACERFKARVFTHRLPRGKESSDHSISKVIIHVRNPMAGLQLETEEGYLLKIDASMIVINASTQVGVMHGLETLSQLVDFDFSEKQYQIGSLPILIEDTPRFKHREVLIDTARHYQPVAMLYRILDSMTYAKINVMHWHLTDTQSFPFDSTSYPLLSEMGAYSPRERYTVEDVEDVVEYARARGIRVVVEIDTPGHAGAMCGGYPEICPSSSCRQPLNPATNKTIQVLEGLFNDLTGGVRGQGLFFDNMMHLGGDEVDTSCWKDTPSVAEWLQSRNMSLDDGYLYLVAKVQAIARAQGRDVVGWEEIWNHFGTKLDKSTIIQQWLPGSSAAKEATASGYRVIWSTDGVWYLDGLKVNWEVMYDQEPCDGLDNHQCDLVIGGGGEMWGETADASDVLQTIWPRLAAISERLWSPRSVRDAKSAAARIVAFRCLLNRRGIPAAPPTNDVARSAPNGPGSCYAQ